MSIRIVVADFVRMGRLPDSRATAAVIGAHQESLKKIDAPISDEEATLLANGFGPDDCYGLAWTLLHLIETAPGGCPVKVEPCESDNEWIRRLWHRSRTKRG